MRRQNFFLNQLEKARGIAGNLGFDFFDDDKDLGFGFGTEKGLLGIDRTGYFGGLGGISEKKKKKKSLAVQWEDSDSEMRFDAGSVVARVQGFR
ncbi:hypothetical protein U1Q18_016694 [Sarracenia purpurea var. burkii]